MNIIITIATLAIGNNIFLLVLISHSPSYLIGTFIINLHQVGRPPGQPTPPRSFQGLLTIYPTKYLPAITSLPNFFQLFVLNAQTGPRGRFRYWLPKDRPLACICSAQFPPTSGSATINGPWIIASTNLISKPGSLNNSLQPLLHLPTQICPDILIIDEIMFDFK
jgi:hypothetical protein